jgi:hypothetical protein
MVHGVTCLLLLAAIIAHRGDCAPLENGEYYVTREMHDRLLVEELRKIIQEFRAGVSTRRLEALHS